MATKLLQPAGILPLIIFRVMFGGLMFVSTLRFILNGWVQTFYIAPTVHFPFLGLEWIRPLPPAWMPWVFVALLLLSAMIALGAFYRVAIVGFFVLFSYVELIDKAYYLNHYYLISLLSFLLCWLPLDRWGSLDAWWRPRLRTSVVPYWTILAIRLLLAIVYIYAGLAKLQPDWLLHAQPITLWLRPHQDLPLLGTVFSLAGVPLLLSWFGVAYDLTIVGFLLWRRTRWLAYGIVILFHLMTGLLFPIGMFPYVMIGCTLIFFDERDYAALMHVLHLNRLRSWLQGHPPARNGDQQPAPLPVVTGVLALFFVFQLVFPWRYGLYPGNGLWTQQGFRFGWRVMLAENTGSTVFMVTDPASGKHYEVYPSTMLTLVQERQMSFQPDMIQQFAHEIAADFRLRGMPDVQVRVEAYASLNGRPSQPLIDPTVDLAHEPLSIWPKDWILPLPDSLS